MPTYTRQAIRSAIERRLRDLGGERFDPTEINETINDVLIESYPSFHSMGFDESTIIIDDTLVYALPSTIEKVLAVWLEDAVQEASGTAESGTANTLTDTDASWTANEWADDYEVAIIDKTGEGQVRTIASNTATVLTVSSNWTTPPDSTSEYVIKKIIERDPWRPLHFWTVTGTPGALVLELHSSYRSGQRLRVQYIGPPDTLSSDSDTTRVPKEYIVRAAMNKLLESILHSAAGGSRSTELTEFLTRWDFELAEQLRRRLGWQYPSTQVHRRPIEGSGTQRGL